MNRFIIATTLSLALFLPSLGSAAPSRIKELADVRGVRENMLIGYGLVVGLSSTGDSQQVLFTTQSISGMLGRDHQYHADPTVERAHHLQLVDVAASLQPIKNGWEGPAVAMHARAHPFG